MNDLNEAISHSLIHHFADKTYVLFSNRSLKIINRYINFDLVQTFQWLIANRISLKSNKTEISLFGPKTIKKNQKT